MNKKNMRSDLIALVCGAVLGQVLWWLRYDDVLFFIVAIGGMLPFTMRLAVEIVKWDKKRLEKKEQRIED